MDPELVEGERIRDLSGICLAGINDRVFLYQKTRGYLTKPFFRAILVCS